MSEPEKHSVSYAEDTPQAVVSLLDGLGLACRDVLTAAFEVKDPLTGAGTGLFIELAGPEHPDRKAIALQIQREARAAIEKQLAETGKVVPLVKDPSETERESLDQMVSYTLNWYRKDGKPVPPFTKAAVRQLYEDPQGQWLVRQVSARLNDLSLFIKA